MKESMERTPSPLTREVLEADGVECALMSADEWRAVRVDRRPHYMPESGGSSFSSSPPSASQPSASSRSSA